MQEAMKSALDRIIVKDNKRMTQIIDWYIANQEYLESQPFKMPFRQGLVCLNEERIDFSFEAFSETEVLMKIYPDQKDIIMVAFKYNPEKDIITEKRWPKNINPKRLNMLKKVEEYDKTCKKEAFKYRVLMYYAVYYHNEVIIDEKQTVKLASYERKTLKKKGNKTPLVRSTYVFEPNEESLKKPADPDKKRHYEKPDHEVKVKGYRRKNGTWVEPYVRYKNKGDGGPKIYKA